MTEMTDQEKSVMLAKLCGWKYRTDGVSFSWYSSNDVLDENGFSYHEWQRTGREFSVVPLNLYDPANMSLAWRVLNWAYSQAGQLGVATWEIEQSFYVFSKPADAQRVWLDKIIELATEAGMVTK